MPHQVAKPPTLGPALDFMSSLWQLNHALERLSKAMESAMGVTAQQRLLIRCIGSFGRTTSVELTKYLHLDRGTISIALGRLQEKGLVKRHQNPKDKRRVNVELTAAGEKIDRPSPLTVEAVVNDLLGISKKSSVRETQELLNKLTQMLTTRASRNERR